MSTLELAELEARCQKPDPRRLGNWMARRITRPLALRITRVVLPLGVSAHAATFAAWGVGLAAAFAFGCGSIAGWLVGAALLQLWYLLDHVDGQLARYLETESLDGAALDYLMHHTMNLLLPIGIGWGLAADGQRAWLAVGLAWGVGSLVVGLVNDVRYKAFIKRLKLLHGELRVVGGGGGRPSPPAMMPARPLGAAAWLARKASEPHVVMNVLGLIAAMQWLITNWLPDDAALHVGRGYATAMGLLACALAARTICRDLSCQATEHEFAAWYRPAEGDLLHFEDGWWRVVSLPGSSAPARSSAAARREPSDRAA